MIQTHIFLLRPPVFHVKNALLGFQPSAHKMENLVAYLAWKGLSLRTSHAEADAGHAPAVWTTNLSCGHVLELQMSYAKNAASVVRALCCRSLVKEQGTLFVRSALLQKDTPVMPT